MHLKISHAEKFQDWYMDVYPMEYKINSPMTLVRVTYPTV